MYAIRSYYGYQISLIKERVNIFFGYSAVTEVKIIHSKISEKAPKLKKKPVKQLSGEEDTALDKKLDKIKEKDLKIALKNLGKAIILRDKQS